MGSIVSETKLENARVELVIEVPADEVEKEFKSVFNKMQRDVKIDGFRKGKVPMSMLEQRFAKAASEEVAERLMRDSLINLLRDKPYNPVATPEYEFDGLERGGILHFKAIIEVYPTVELGEYKGIAVDEKTCDVTDADVEHELEHIRERFKKAVKKEAGDTIADGDMVKLRFKKKNIEGEHERTYSAVIGEDDDEYAVEHYIRGWACGDEKDVTINYPEDYVQKDLAGKEIIYTVKVEEASHEILPELSDELAKEAQFESLEDMRTKTRDMINSFVANKTVGEAKGSIINKVVLESKFDIPETVIKDETRSAIARTKNRLAERMGTSPDVVQAYTDEDVAAIVGLMPEEFNAYMRNEAENSVKTMLVLAEVIKKEGIKVSEEAYRAHVAKQAEDFGKSIEEFEELIANSDFKQSVERQLAIEQAVDFLYANANINKLAPVSVEELLKPEHEHNL